MKRILPVLLVGVLIISGFGAGVAVNAESEKLLLQEDIYFSEPALIDQNNYLSVEIKEATSYATSPGNPMLPMYTKLFSFPLGTIIKDVSFTAASEQTIELTKEILPAARPTPISDSLIIPSNQKQVKNEEVYSAQNTYPLSRLDYQIGAGLDENEHVILLSICYYPLLYLPQQQTLLFTPSVQITVTYEQTQYSNSLSTENKLLIITPEEFTEALHPLVVHKNQYNIQTTLVTTEWITAHSTGRDLPEQIKYTIKDAIETDSITSVLLVGGYR